MGAIWILFIPFLVIVYASSEKKIKKLNKRIKRLEKQVKGNQEMSRLLEELKGQKVKVTVNGFGTEYEIMDIDEDWVIDSCSIWMILSTTRSRKSRSCEIRISVP